MALPTPEELAAQDELIGIVDSILGQLGHAPREAFILFTVDGFTVEEIAGITGALRRGCPRPHPRRPRIFERRTADKIPTLGKTHSPLPERLMIYLPGSSFVHPQP